MWVNQVGSNRFKISEVLTMANSRVGQYRLEYELSGFTAPTRTHKLGFWIAPTAPPASGALPSAISIQLLGGGTATLQSVANGLLDFIRPLYPTTVTIGSFNLWKYVTEYSRDFVSAGTANTAVVGTGGSVVAQQLTISFRHANGGIGKVVALECNIAGDAKSVLIPNPAGDRVQKLASYLLSTASPMIALDNSFPVAPLFSALGQNESVWRKVYRS